MMTLGKARVAAVAWAMMVVATVVGGEIVTPRRDTPSKDDIVAGLKQRETSIADISYRVSTKEYQEGNDQPVSETLVFWMAKDDMFRYETARKDSNGEVRKAALAYDGKLTQGRPADRDAGKLNSESYYLRYSGKYYSTIVSERDFTVEKVSSSGESELYLLTGAYSPSLQMAILVDATKGFYPRKISLWAPSRGHSIEKPTFEYETTKSALCDGLWLPQECSYRENPLFDHSKASRMSKSFSDVQVNQGLTKDAFTNEWPQGTRIDGESLNMERQADRGNMAADGSKPIGSEAGRTSAKYLVGAIVGIAVVALFATVVMRKGDRKGDTRQ